MKKRVKSIHKVDLQIINANRLSLNQRVGNLSPKRLSISFKCYTKTIIMKIIPFINIRSYSSLFLLARFRSRQSLLALFLFILFSPVYSQEIIFSEDFESGKLNSSWITHTGEKGMVDVVSRM